MKQHGRKWLYFVRGLLGNHADAEDVLQESVRRVLARDRPLESEDQLRMYLSRVIGNTAIDAFHTRERDKNRYLPLEETMFMTPDAEGPHRQAELREDRASHRRVIGLIREGLHHLPDKQVEALRLTVLAPRAPSIRQAGSSSGIPYSTLRHRAIQGIRGLRRYVKRRSRAHAPGLRFGTQVRL